MGPAKLSAKQARLWLEAGHLRAYGSCPFCRRLNQILDRAKSGTYVEPIYHRCYAPAMGRPSIACPLRSTGLLRAGRHRKAASTRFSRKLRPLWRPNQRNGTGPCLSAMTRA